MMLGTFLLLLLSSCGNQDKKQESEHPQEETPTAEENADIKQWFTNPVLDGWFHQLQLEDSSLEESKFALSKTDSLNVTSSSAKISDEDWNIYQPYFFYAPDHSRAIDLYSYGTMPVKQRDGSVMLESGEADNEVSIIDVAGRTKKRLLFSGPGTIYQKAAWEGDSVVIITGISDANQQNKMLPVIWRISLADSSLQQYNYFPDSLPQL